MEECKDKGIGISGQTGTENVHDVEGIQLKVVPAVNIRSAVIASFPDWSRTKMPSRASALVLTLPLLHVSQSIKSSRTRKKKCFFCDPIIHPIVRESMVKTPICMQSRCILVISHYTRDQGDPSLLSSRIWNSLCEVSCPCMKVFSPPAVSVTFVVLYLTLSRYKVGFVAMTLNSTRARVVKDGGSIVCSMGMMIAPSLGMKELIAVAIGTLSS